MSFPSTFIDEWMLTVIAGLVSTVPSTDTRPSWIQLSPSRREQRPARASRLAIRSDPFWVILDRRRQMRRIIYYRLAIREILDATVHRRKSALLAPRFPRLSHRVRER